MTYQGAYFSHFQSDVAAWIFQPNTNWENPPSRPSSTAEQEPDSKEAEYDSDEFEDSDKSEESAEASNSEYCSDEYYQ